MARLSIMDVLSTVFVKANNAVTQLNSQGFILCGVDVVKGAVQYSVWRNTADLLFFFFPGVIKCDEWEISGPTLKSTSKGEKLRKMNNPVLLQ